MAKKYKKIKSTEKTIKQILQLLNKEKKPISANYIQRKTGTNYNSVCAALYELTYYQNIIKKINTSNGEFYKINYKPYLKKLYNLNKNKKPITFKTFKKMQKEITQLEPRIITPKKRYKVLERQNWMCNTCGKKLRYSKNSTKEWNKKYPIAEMDHIHAWSKQKTYPRGKENINEISNLQALCPECNKKKGDKLIH